MEIKSLGYLPVELLQALSDMQLYPASFSKVGTVYRNHILQEGIGLSCPEQRKTA
jgi:hypothetical protein